MRSPLLPVAGWPAQDAERYRALGYWTDETFSAFLADRAVRFADRVAVVGAPAADPKGRGELTYAQLLAAADGFAAVLASRGVGAGDRVVLQLPNCLEYVVAVFGAFRLGAVPVFALPAHRELEITQFCATADAAALVVAGSRWGHDYLLLAANVATALREQGIEPPAVVDVERERSGGIPAVVPAAGAAEDVAFLQLSGGTTGVPKLIPRTAADYLYSVRESAGICGVTADTVMLVALPAAHNFPMSSPGILGVLHAGGTVVLAPDPSPRTCLRLIQQERVTMTSLVPPLLHALLSAVEGRRDRYDLSSLTTIQVGGARLADTVATRVRPELGAQLQQVFGMAEGLVNYTRLDDPDALVTTTQGRPISPHDEVRVEADGQLLTRGPYTIRGYYGGRSPESFTADGFYRTGDLVRVLPSGHIQVIGRVKDQINRGGEKIAIEEVENLLLTHPAVHDVAVVAVADDYSGERICAYVVPSDSAEPPSTADLREFLRGLGLAPFKLPDRVECLAEFPSTGVGKTSRRDLRRLLSAAS